MEDYITNIDDCLEVFIPQIQKEGPQEIKKIIVDNIDNSFARALLVACRYNYSKVNQVLDMAEVAMYQNVSPTTERPHVGEVLLIRFLEDRGFDIDSILVPLRKGDSRLDIQSPKGNSEIYLESNTFDGRCFELQQFLLLCSEEYGLEED